jgi:penicillin-binding protein 1A
VHRLRAWTASHRRAVAIAASSTFVVLVLIVVVAPLRRATTLALSRLTLIVAAPLVPSIRGFEDLPEPTTVVAADGSVLGTISGSEAREYVHLDALPAHVKHAALAAEDQNFYGHGGIDPAALARAALRNITGHREGGSTITQQLAKINYAGSRRTLFRKFREALYTLKLEQKYTKDELLERYLNQAYFGDGTYGIAAAAEATFGVAATSLTPAQAALLTGRIRGPESRDPRTHARLATARRNVVLGIMHGRGWLKDDAYRQALATPLALSAEPQAPGVVKAPHFVGYVTRAARRLDELGGSLTSRSHRLATGGLRIETTLDPKAFDAAAAAVQSQLGQPGDPATAVVSVVPGDGAIVALYGGDATERKFDVASQGHRQTGSSFKPFVYLAALRAGIDPRSVIDGTSPKTLTYKGETYTVDNYEGESPGGITIDDALMHSVNTVFAQLVLQPNVGPAAVVQSATDAGIDDDELKRDRDRPSVALGGLTRGVTPLEMANAYATFAAKGVRAEPYAITRVLDRDGDVLYEHHTKTAQAIDEKLVGVLNAALIRVVQGGTGVGAQVPGWTIGGKTGTTQNYGDAWFIGITPPLATSVWVGHADRIVPMTNVHGRRVNGGSFPASIFAATMRVELAGTKPQALFTASPDGLGLTMLGPPPTSSTSTPTTETTEVPTTEFVEPTPTPTTTATPTTQPPTTTTKKPTTTTTTGSPPSTAKADNGKGNG